MSARSSSNVRKHKLPFYFSATLCVVCLVLLLWGYVKYSTSDVGDDAVQVVGLLAIPLLLQTLGLFFLYRKLRGDGSIWSFYWYYMTGMVLASVVVYASMWVGYPSYTPNANNLPQIFQYLPLILIGVLLIPLGGVTYSLMQPPEDDAGLLTKSQREKKSLSKLKSFWNHFILVKDVKESVSKVPFWALLFFFSIFLVIVFLFGFAFAAHQANGIAVLKEKNNHNSDAIKNMGKAPENDPAWSSLPPLYISKLYASEAEKQRAVFQYNKEHPGVQSAGSSSLAEPSNPEGIYEFFFHSNSEYLISDATVRPKDEQEIDWNWKKQQNQNHLKEIVDKVDKNTKNGERVIIQLSGHADDKNPNPKIFPSNYELSGGRASKVQAEILNTLLRKEDRWRNIEWYHEALSSEEPPDIPEDVIPEISRLEAEFQIDTFPEYKNEIDGSKKKLKDLHNQMQKMTTQEGREVLSLLQRIHGLIHPQQPTPTDQMPKIKSQVENCLASLDYNIRRLEHLDKDAKRRSVSVRISSAQASPTSELKQYEEKLGLLDFIYFTLTGFGDIIPTTSYAKFLCTFLKVVDVFFIVVFFNALLSVRRNRRPTRIKVFPASGGGGSIGIISNDGYAIAKKVREARWLSLGEPSIDNGTAKISFSVDEHDSAHSRSEDIAFGDEIFTIWQEGLKCEYTIRSTKDSFSSDGGNGTITVSTLSSCLWKPVSSKPQWLKISSEERRGEGKVEFKVDTNTEGKNRRAYITIGGQKISIKQSANNSAVSSP